ncbi:hypothetical protein [Actinophytocola sediminis]
MGDVDTWFLLIQYKRAGRTDVQSFDDPAVAAAAYGDAERRYKDRIRGLDRTVDVLLVGASSLDVVKERYPSYFAREKSVSAKVRKLLDSLPPVPAH